MTAHRTRRAAALALLLLLPAAARAQAGYASFQAFLDSLEAVAARPDAAAREAGLDAIWSDLRAAGQVPFRHGDRAAFLYRSAAAPASVAVAGDHTGWQPNAPLRRLGASSLWLREDTLPDSARIDYKLVVGGTWILDPANPHQQWSGFGPNSELRMPAWRPSPDTAPRAGAPRGTLSAPVTMPSAAYGAPVVYRVYTPAGYAEGAARLPVLYVTDGHEYADDRLGALSVVLDNLVADGRAAPALVVYIDPRYGGQNRRQQQYVQNPGFAAFVATELVPAIDAAYRTRADRDGRVILGTSLGGVFATYLGLEHPDVFGRLAVQSPAYWVTESAQWWSGPSLFERVAAAPEGLFRITLSAGTINDGAANARRMRDLLAARSHAITYRETAEGHSWGQWRALLPEVLAQLVPGPAVTDAEDAPVRSGLRLEAR
ncbi:MAG: alpha/beta hydrolase-fold protein, partial [Rubricoccaceae bacterium]